MEDPDCTIAKGDGDAIGWMPGDQDAVYPGDEYGDEQ